MTGASNAEKNVSSVSASDMWPAVYSQENVCAGFGTMLCNYDASHKVMDEAGIKAFEYVLGLHSTKALQRYDIEKICVPGLIQGGTGIAFSCAPNIATIVVIFALTGPMDM